MNKRFRVCDLNQPFLLAPSLQDWLPEDHLARFVADVMNELDLSAIYAEYERNDGRGLSAYHPLLLTRLLLYGYSIGVTSSRAIEKATYDHVAFRYLAADQHPDHDTIAGFRQEHLEALASLFVQALRLCQQAGLVKLGNVALDGTKILANASTRRSVGYQKLSEREQYWQAVVEQLLGQAQQTDQEEDQRFGQGQAADPLPAELTRAQSRLNRIRQAKAELEKEAEQQLQVAAEKHTPRKHGRPAKQDPAGQEPQDPQERAKEKNRLRRAKQNAQQPTRQYNFVDPDSRVMRDNARKSFVQGYNAQIAVDAQQQVIVAAEVTQQVTDREQLLPMVQSVCATTQGVPETVTADAGYWDTTSLRDPSLQGIQVLVSPDAQVLSPDTPLPPTVPKNQEAMRMRERLLSPAGNLLYVLRKATVEPVFGQIKETRGLRRFRFRGLKRVQCEWKLICATHNLLKLFRYRAALARA
ncbi:MAG TPA: IS1182 family transposase [Candidatus Angelobacter sp.]|nr:IS1182 family transposase [Candidatus Angelobacter sp.]